MGANPLLRAFVICVVAGLGSVAGAGFAAVALGLFEAAIQILLRRPLRLPADAGALSIVVLIWKPAGLFGQQEVSPGHDPFRRAPQAPFCALLLFVLMAMLPLFVTQRYLLGEVITCMLWVSVALQWNVLMGHAGVFSLGQMLSCLGFIHRCDVGLLSWRVPMVIHSARRDDGGGCRACDRRRLFAVGTGLCRTAYLCHRVHDFNADHFKVGVLHYHWRQLPYVLGRHQRVLPVSGLWLQTVAERRVVARQLLHCPGGLYPFPG